MTDNIASRAMIVYMNASQWTARKLDRQATSEVTANHAAASDAGRFNKQVIDKEALAPIQQVVSAARTYLYDHTLPWSDNGDRVLSSMNYFEVMGKLQDYAAEFKAAVDTFCNGYNQHRERAKLKLNSLFKESDYPYEHEVRSKFAFSFGVLPLPTAGDFRVDMSNDVVDEVRAEIEQQLNARVQGMMSSVWEDLTKTVTHLRDRLQSDGKLFDSTLNNVTDLLSRIPGLNICDDVALENTRKDLHAALAGLEMKDIKKDEKLKQSTIGTVNDILRQMQGLT